MPFEVVKVKRGFKVQDDKGRFYSKKPLTKKVAREQQKALYASENNKTLQEGKGYMSYIDGAGNRITLMEGDGFFSDTWARIKRNTKKIYNVMKPILTVQNIQTISQAAAQGIRQNYSPQVRQVLSQYGEGQVYALKIFREPIKQVINDALNIISLGKWNEARQQYDFDTLYHLSMIAALSMPNGDQAFVKIEKNEVINITPDIQYKSQDFEYIDVPVQCCFTLNEMLSKAQQLMGPLYFTYDAFNNNCQVYLAAILQANGLLTPDVKGFILQDVSSLLKDIPSYVQPFANLTTNLAGLANSIVFGEGENQQLIDFEDMKWGSFTEQFNAYNRQHKKKFKSLKAFASHILKNEKDFKEITKKRARFYKNVILKGGRKITNSQEELNALDERIRTQYAEVANDPELIQVRGMIQDGMYKPSVYDEMAKKLLDKRMQSRTAVSNITDEELAQAWKDNRNFKADFHNLRNNPKNATVNGITYDELGNEVFNKDKHTSIEWLNSIEGRRRREHDVVLDEYFKKKVKEQGLDEKKLEQDYQKELQDTYGDSQLNQVNSAIGLTARNTDFKTGVRSYRHRKDGGIDIQYDTGHWESTPGEKDWNCNHYEAGDIAESAEYCRDERGQKAFQNLENRVNRERDAQWDNMSFGDKLSNGFAVLGSVGQDYILPAVGVVADFIPGGQAIGALANLGSAVMDSTISGCRHFNECTQEQINKQKEQIANARTKGDEFTERVLKDDDWASLVRENSKAKELVKGKLNEWGMLPQQAEATGEGKPQYDVNPVLAKQLREIKMSPKEYLDIAREAAELEGYDPRALEFSDSGNQKLMMYDDEGNKTHFGAVGYGDYIIWSKSEAMGKVRKGYAQQKRNVFRRSHLKIKGDWKKDKFSANNLAINILWSDKQ